MLEKVSLAATWTQGLGTRSETQKPIKRPCGEMEGGMTWTGKIRVKEYLGSYDWVVKTKEEFGGGVREWEGRGTGEMAPQLKHLLVL